MNIEDIKNNMIPYEIKYICMECEENIHCQDKGCAYRSLGNEYCDYVLQATKLYLEKDKEIERLNNIINKKEQFLGDNIKRLEREVVKRDNIINKGIEYILGNDLDNFDNINNLLNILKGSGSNEHI